MSIRNNRADRGFTLIELLLVVAIIAVLAAIAMPSLLRSKITANETSAIATLRTLYVAQEQFRSACIVDQNGNGAGEYGFLQELAGDEVPRTRASALRTGEFVSQTLGATSGGIAAKSGYHFLVYLPNAADGAIAETDGPAASVPANAPVQEIAWVCYAWPVNRGTSGNRAFVVNQQGLVFVSDNAHPRNYYSGTANVPPALSAYAVPARAGLAGPIASTSSMTATDNGNWRPLGGGG